MRQKAIFIFVIVLMNLSMQACAGERVAYSRLTDGFWQIWMMDGDGGNQKQLTQTPEDKRSPFWIKVDQRIGYRTSNGELFTVDLNGQNSKELLPEYRPMTNPDYSLATNELVFVRFIPNVVDIGDIWKANLKTMEAAVLTKDKFMSFQPRISSNGKKIVFVRLDEARNHQISVMNSDGTGEISLTQGVGRRTLPDISPDGEEVMFASNHANSDYDLYRIDLATQTLSQIFMSAGLDTSPRYSLDGSKIAFISTRSGEKHIWVMDRNGKNLKQLTVGAPSIDPVWMEK